MVNQVTAPQERINFSSTAIKTALSGLSRYTVEEFHGLLPDRDEAIRKIRGRIIPRIRGKTFLFRIQETISFLNSWTTFVDPPRYSERECIRAWLDILRTVESAPQIVLYGSRA